MVGIVCVSVILICKSLSRPVSQMLHMCSCHCISSGLMSARVISCSQATERNYALAATAAVWAIIFIFFFIIELTGANEL